MIIHYILLACLIAIAFYTDVKTATISNRLTITVTLLAFGIHAATGGWKGFAASFIGFGAGVGLFMVLYVCKAIGAGDVKLFGAIGALMGLHFTLYSMMYAILYAGFIGLLILLFRKRLFAKVMQMFNWLIWVIVGRNFSSLNYSAHHAVLTFPFMYAVAPAVITTLWVVI